MTEQLERKGTGHCWATRYAGGWTVHHVAYGVLDAGLSEPEADSILIRHGIPLEATPCPT